MSDEEALLAAINEHPLDDAPRLVYADWLDEHADNPPAPTRRTIKPKPGANAARAEFIRVQCELAVLPPSDPRYAELEARAAKLLIGRRREWCKPFKGGTTYTQFWRGFPVPYLGHLSLHQLMELGADDLAGAPLWRFGTVYGTDLDAVLAWSQLHRLATFTLGPAVPKGWAQRVAECDGLRNVTELYLSALPMTSGDLKRILDAWTGRRLIELLLNDSPLRDVGARVLAKHPALAGLRTLWAHSTQLTEHGIQMIVDSSYLENLTIATFAHNPIGDAGGEYLLRWKALPHIRELYLMNTGLSADVQEKLRTVLGTRVRL